MVTGKECQWVQPLTIGVCMNANQDMMSIIVECHLSAIINMSYYDWRVNPSIVSLCGERTH